MYEDALTWERRFMRLAQQVSEWSKDPEKKVGAVIVKDRRVIGTGYNGFPPHVADTFDRLDDKPTRKLFTVHAEMNALLRAGVKSDGASLFVFDLPPCPECCKHIAAARIKDVYYPGRMEGEKDKFLISREVLKECGIPLIAIKGE